MSESAGSAGALAWQLRRRGSRLRRFDGRPVRRRPPAHAAAWEAPDARRWLQLTLAAVWLLDAVLQYQSFMFTRAFSQMLGATAAGNPAVVASPISWDARLIGHHTAGINTAFATIQLLLALGIAWRPTVKIALGASVAWALGVWWFGEGLGGVLTGNASPVNGAPGAVLLYALLAVLLWPAHPAALPDDRAPLPAGAALRSSAEATARSSFVAARPFGTRPARLLWLTLWGSLAYFAVQSANRTSQGLHDMIMSMSSGEPSWLVAIDKSAASLVAGRGATASVILAVVLAVIAASVFLPVPAARAGLVLAIVTAAAIWVVGQAFGGIFTGAGTDPNSGPLLALLAVAYWPLRPAPDSITPGPDSVTPASDSVMPARLTSAPALRKG
jgi:hypothetical protein